MSVTAPQEKVKSKAPQEKVKSKLNDAYCMQS